MAGAAVQNVGVVESVRKTKAAQATPPKPDAERGEGFGQALEDARRREVKGHERPIRAAAKKESGRGAGSLRDETTVEAAAAGAVEEAAKEEEGMLAIEEVAAAEVEAGAGGEGEVVKEAAEPDDQVAPPVVSAGQPLAAIAVEADSGADAGDTVEKLNWELTGLCGGAGRPAAALTKELSTGDETESLPETGGPQGAVVATSGKVQLASAVVPEEAEPVAQGLASWEAKTSHDAGKADGEIEPAVSVVEGEVPSDELAVATEVAPSDVKAENVDAGADAMPAVESGVKAAVGGAAKTAPPSPTAKAPAPAEIRFSEVNHDRIVTGVRGQLLPHGGSMQIRLDPPELGALQVMVEMRDGVMTAMFQTSNDEATRLLSHSLNQLKHVLEAQGVSVEKLQVQQGPRNEGGSNAGGNQEGREARDWAEEQAARQEQQRKEILRRMWRKVLGDADPLDLVA